MSSCDAFNVNFTGSAQDFFNHAAQLLQQNNGTISGGPAGGSFSVPALTSSITGDFSISGQTCSIHVSDHPFFITCGAIQDYVHSHV